MKQQEVSYKQILDAATDYLVSDTELRLNKSDVHPTSSLSRNLKMDDAAKIQTIKYIEETLNLDQINEDEILNKKLGNLAEFCHAIYAAIMDKKAIFAKLNEYLQNRYGVLNARPADSLFVDLHFNELDRSELCVWAENTFDIILPTTYFINLDDFCDKVHYAIERKKMAQEQKTGFFDKLYNSLYQYKFWKNQKTK